MTTASGRRLSPVYLSPTRGTGITGTIRPDFTGQSLYDAPPGLSLNPYAVSAPSAGMWGNAGRNSISGPITLNLIASMSRSFRFGDRINADLRFDSQNPLNHVTFPSWNVTYPNAQFGLPSGANAMRSLQATFRLRY